MTRAAMARAGIDVLIATDPSNQAWLTGYDGWSFYVHQAVILPMDAQARLVGPQAGRQRRGAHGRIRADRCHRLSRQLRAVDRHATRCSILRACWPIMGLGKRRASASRWTTTITRPRRMRSLAARPAAGDPDRRHRAGELAARREIGRGTRLHAQGRPDHREDPDVTPSTAPNPACARTIWSPRSWPQGIHGVGDDWGDYPAIVPLLPSGSDAAAPHLTWDGRPMQTGQATFFELAGCYRRYHVPLSRTVFLGTPPDYIRRAEAALIEGLEAGLDAARARQPRLRHRRCAWSPRWSARASNAARAAAIRSACPIRPTGASARYRLRDRRPDHPETRHDLPLHARPVDGRLGAGDHRIDPDRRGRPGGNLLRRCRAS